MRAMAVTAALVGAWPVAVCAADTAAAPSPKPRCFGAAARAPGAQCTNPQLVRKVVPSPLDALLESSARCRPEERRAELRVCSFGRHRTEAQWNIALVGDSHAGAWRGALVEVAEKAGWRGRSMTKAGCAFSTAIPLHQPKTRQDVCRRFNTAVVRWLRDHPEVTTVFVGANSAHRQGGERGFRQMWKRLPDSVRHIIVLRDPPRRADDTFSCIVEAMEKRKDAGRACRVKRKAALGRDLQTVAAARWGRTSQRVGVVDLTPHMCNRRFCFPVVGGVLVQRDVDHLTDTFSRSMGRYVLRQVENLLRGWGEQIRLNRCEVLPVGVALTAPRGDGQQPPAALLSSPLAGGAANFMVELVRDGRVVLRGFFVGELPAGETKFPMEVVKGESLRSGEHELRVIGTRKGCKKPATRRRMWNIPVISEPG